MQLSLNKLRLHAPLDASGECLVLTELVLPRNGIARRAAANPVELRKGLRSFQRVPFYESAVLKEKVDGRFGLKVSVTRPLKNPEFSQFIRQFLATGIESSVDLLSPFLTRHSLLEDLLEEAGDQLAERIGKAPAFIASGGIDLESEHLVAGPIQIPLQLTERIRSSAELPLSQKRDKRKAAAKTYRKGSAIGEMTLDLTP